MSTHQGPMILAEELCKSFRGQLVLDRLGMRIDALERVALVGPNGAGKTTLIRCLLGEYVFEGTLRIAGEGPRHRRHLLLSRIGFVPQRPPPLRMPVRDLLGFAASLCREDVRCMEDVAQGLGLDVRAVGRQLFTKLSGGQQQKLLLAVALGRSCDLLILDEPAANLDPEARRTFLELLSERRGRATMLISSHRLDEIARLVERVVELDRGRVVLDEPVADAVLSRYAGLVRQIAPAETISEPTRNSP